MKVDPDFKRIIKTLYDDLLVAWNGCEAEVFAGLFSHEGNLIGFDGSRANGSVEIKRHLSKIFQDHRTGLFIGIVKEIRRINETVFLLQAVAGMVPAGEKDIHPDLNCIQTLISSMYDDRFLIELFQTTPAALNERTDLSEQLTDELRQTLQELKDTHAIPFEK
jgi:uncharacterized protein (TIGR02246 family)